MRSDSFGVTGQLLEITLYRRPDGALRPWLRARGGSGQALRRRPFHVPAAERLPAPSAGAKH